MIKSYFKIALRNFRQHKVFTLINIVGLSIGISSALVIYLIVHFDLTFDKFHKDGDRIYRVTSEYTFSGESISNSGVTGPLPAAAKSEVSGLAETAPFYTLDGYKVAIDNGQKQIRKFRNEKGLIFADAGFFNLFNYTWLVGSAKTALSNPYQVVLTDRQAKKYFPDLSYQQMIGKRIVYEDTIKAAVSGIVKELDQNTDLTFHDFVSHATINVTNDLKSQLEDWGGTTSSSQFFVKLTPGTTPKQIERQLNGLLKKYNPPKKEDKGNTHQFRLQPLSDIHFGEYAYDNATVNKNTLYGLVIIALFLLALGCINFINLTTAQGAQRAKEIGVRKTMGCSRKQLITQFLSETFLITLFAVVISVAICPFILKLFSDFVPKGLKMNLLEQPGLILFLLILTVFVSFLSGFYPAMVLSGYKPVLVMKNQAAGSSSKTRNAMMRKSLTVVQFVIAQFFIMATIMVSKQIDFALHKDLGFKKDAIVYMEAPYKASKAAKQVFFNKVKAIPQVELYSIGASVPSSGGWNSSDVTFIDGKKEIKTDLQTKSGDENFIKVYHIKLLAGRNITLADSANALMINANYAHLIGFKDVRNAIGQTINFGEKEKRQVVGVFGDFHQNSLHAPVKPLAIYPQMYNMTTIHIALKPKTAGGNEWNTAISSMQQAWKESFPDDDFDYHFFDENIAKMYDKEQHLSSLLTWATGLSIFISCLGLLGLAIYTTNLRTKEIGVRKVLGASVAQIVGLLSRELMLLILLASVIVTPVAYYSMNRWLEGFADRTAVSWWIFAVSAAGMLLASAFTSGFQTIKAATSNPVKSLRSE